MNENQAKKFMQEIADPVINLYHRWLEEKEYEPFEEYETVMKNLISDREGFVFIKGTRKPFGFKFRTGEGTYHIQLRMNGSRIHFKIKQEPS